ncbi:hypothetical protein D3C87_2155970 [compost metagenome]
MEATRRFATDRWVAKGAKGAQGAQVRNDRGIGGRFTGPRYPRALEGPAGIPAAE